MCHLQEQEPKHTNQRDNILKVSKITAKYIPCLNSLAGVVPINIKHLHTEKTATANTGYSLPSGSFIWLNSIEN